MHIGANMRLSVACAFAIISTAALAQSVFSVTPDQIQWKEMRKTPQLYRANVLSEQEKPGPFAFRVRAAAGHKLMPHTHPDDRTIIVLQGTYWSAVGSTYDESKLIAYPTGSLYVVPAGVPHYSAVLEGETIFQESGNGPSRNDMIPQSGQ